MACREQKRICRFVLLMAVLFHAAVFQSEARGGLLSNLTFPYMRYLDDMFDRLAESHPNVSEDCRRDTRSLLRSAEAGDSDALKVFDSIGKPSSGILEGAIHFQGYFSECIKTQLGGKYCLLHCNFSSRPASQVLPQASLLVLGDKPPSIGVCVPTSCSEDDVLIAAEDAGVLDAGIEGSPVCQVATSGLGDDASAKVALSFFVLLALLALSSTAWDYASEYRSSRLSTLHEDIKVKSQSVEILVQDDPAKTDGPSRLSQFLFAFSLRSNARKIFGLSPPGGDGIASLHGIRLYSMLLIIFGHTYSFATQNLQIRNSSAAAQAPKDFFSQFFANGTLAVDSFYFISGLLLALVTLKMMQKTDGKLPILYFYFHRYFRLTPLLVGVVVFCAYLLRYLGSGPNWLGSIQMYDVWCRENWWLNALYLHNFIHTESMCLSHSWYLATDMQMYLVTPIILIPLHKCRKIGFAVLGAFLLATTITTAAITAVNHYPAIPYINNALPAELVNEYYRVVYIKPYCRIGPYLVGIAAGYFLLHNKELRISKTLSGVLWVAMLSSGLSVIYLMWPANQGRIPSDGEAAAYSALARTVWAVGLAWLTFACHYGYGGVVNGILSWRPLVPFSRLTYAAYLIHPVVMNVYYGTFQTEVDFSQATLIYMFLGNLCITYALSIVLSLLLESPFVALEKMIISRKT